MNNTFIHRIFLSLSELAPQTNLLPYSLGTSVIINTKYETVRALFIFKYIIFESRNNHYKCNVYKDLIYYDYLNWINQ